MEKFIELKNLVVSAETDAVKFYEKGNGSAGTRLRKTMQDIKAVAQDIRNEITQMKRAK